jgi:protein involved in plasmid replication-relaxation
VSYPPGYPLVSSRNPGTARTGGGSHRSSPTKDLRSYSRLSARQLAAIEARLSARDREILKAVGRFRAMSGEQLQRLFWPEGSPQTRARLARHGLARLTELEVLAPLARRIGGVRSGSAGRCFAVGLAGQRLLATEASTRRVRRPYTPGERFLAHTLAVCNLYVELVASGVEVLAYDAEPDCWRPYLAAYGARAVCKPDAYFKLATTEYEYSWLVERDMATESLGTVERQARRHLDYHRSGVERRTRGVAPRVAWIVPDERRAEAVQAALDRLPAEAKKLFAVATSADAITLLTAGTRS